LKDEGNKQEVSFFDELMAVKASDDDTKARFVQFTPIQNDEWIDDEEK